MECCCILLRVLRFSHIIMHGSSLTPSVLVFMFDLGSLYLSIYWCPVRFPYYMIFESLNSNTTGVTSGAGTAKPFGGIRVHPCFLVGSLVRNLQFYA